MDHNFPNRRWKMGQMNLVHMAALTTGRNRMEMVLIQIKIITLFKTVIFIIQISNQLRKILKAT